MKVPGVTIAAPASAPVEVAFLVTASAALHNNGPDGPVNGDVTITISLPGDCTASSATTVVVRDRVLSMSVPVSTSRSWNITCLLAGEHQFAVEASLAFSAGQATTDPNPSNNSGNGTATVQLN